MRSAWLWTGVSLGVVLFTWCACRWVQERREQREFEQAAVDMESGRIHVARQRLLGLLKRRPGSSDVAYKLGVCEQKLGHLDAAIAVWSGVATDSPLFNKASLGRGLALMDTGRYALAEELLKSIPENAGPDATEARPQVEKLLRIEGRTQETRDLIVAAWRGAAQPSDVLKRLYKLDDPQEYPLAYIRDALNRGDPDDDRVWLGQANLAVWLGQYDLAVRWLDACERRRPDDQPVWLARLALALASRDVDGARRAMKHVRAAWFLPCEALRHRAWLASFRGDDQAERRGLLEQVAAEPGNTSAWARLAELAHKAARRDQAESYRKKQAEMSALRERYGRLIVLADRVRHAQELAHLATALGRAIEARGWSLIWQRQAALPLRPKGAAEPDLARPTRSLSALIDDGETMATRPAPRTLAGRSVIPPAFNDDAEKVGLRFMHDNGKSGNPPPPPEAMCGGVGLLDYDGDGWLDVFAVQSGPFPPTESARGEGDRLFRNRGDGTFEDTTERAGIASFRRGYGHGVTIGDYDNDGRPDLFITRWRSYALYHNKPGGGFEDVTGRAGLAGDRDWPTSAAFADFDGDGDLDLYVCHYLGFDPANLPPCAHSGPSGGRGCVPRDFPSLRDHIFRNDNGQFVDVTAQAGCTDRDGRGLGVVAADFDDDNKIDLYVANDMSANYLFHNQGAFRFEETGQFSGAAVSADGLFKAGMGIACGDFDGDGELDLAVTNFFGESTTFYRNLGHGLFVDHTATIGLLAPSRPLLGFGVAFPDVNNDGWLDLLSTNGHVTDGRPRVPLAMPLQLLMGSPGGSVSEVSERSGLPFRPLHLGRGLAVGDLDNDGRLDALVLNQNEPLVYLHNTTEKPGHHIRFSLEGTRSNRDGVGARVTIAAGGRRRMAERTGGGSYQSANDPRLHFGLGDCEMVESVEVRWPSGQIDRHQGLPADRDYRLREGATSPPVK